MFQFITLAGFDALNHSVFELAKDYVYTATRDQPEVGTGYFDEIAQAIAQGEPSHTRPPLKVRCVPNSRLQCKFTLR